MKVYAVTNNFQNNALKLYIRRNKNISLITKLFGHYLFTSSYFFSNSTRTLSRECERENYLCLVLTFQFRTFLIQFRANYLQFFILLNIQGGTSRSPLRTPVGVAGGVNDERSAPPSSGTLVSCKIFPPSLFSVDVYNQSLVCVCECFPGLPLTFFNMLHYIK